MNQSGIFYVVATPIGNLDDISRRAAEVLQRVDGIYAEDTRHSRRLLDHLGLSTPLRSLHEHNERGRIDEVASRLEAGESLALISDAGTPLISDPGFPVVRALRERGLQVSPVPGASALVAALSVSGLPSDRFRFEGFLPPKAKARVKALQDLVLETATLVFYESSHRVLGSLRDLAEVFGGERPACLARELTKRYETILHGDLTSLVQRLEADSQQSRGEFVLIVAGACEATAAQSLAVDERRLLTLLSQELAPSRAVKLAAELTGRPRRLLYDELQAMQGKG
jgi:16S rRNA (cytidine1402-2'-O)-methyltransferase